MEVLAVACDFCYLKMPQSLSPSVPQFLILVVSIRLYVLLLWLGRCRALFIAEAQDKEVLGPSCLDCSSVWRPRLKH